MPAGTRPCFSDANHGSVDFDILYTFQHRSLHLRATCINQVVVQERRAKEVHLHQVLATTTSFGSPFNLIKSLARFCRASENLTWLCS